MLAKMNKTVTFNGDPTAFYLKFAVNVKDEKANIKQSIKKSRSEKKDCWDVADVSGQRLTQFPKSIYNKPSLVRYLYMQDNQLTSLPKDLFKTLENLEWLDIRNNRIAKLPQLKGHKRLRCLLAENNRLDSLPEDIWTARNLSNLSLASNDLDETILTIWEEGVPNLMYFYKQKGVQNKKMMEHKDSIDSGVFEDGEKCNEEYLDEDQSRASHIEAIIKDEKIPVDEGLEDESTGNSNSCYEILDNNPKLESDNIIKIIDKTHNESSKDIEKEDIERRTEKYTKFLEEQEIIHFMKNKNLQETKHVQFSSEFENFDEFLYYYKSFHSPLIDKEFDGFSLDYIKTETRNNDDQKKEQLDKRQIWDKLQVMKDKEAMAAWREKYKDLKKKKQKEFENNLYDIEIKLDPPYATDPDWSLATSMLLDNVFSLGSNDAKMDDIVKATVALENEFDQEVEKVIKSTDQPGKLDEAKLRARSARIGRIEEKLKQVKMKARTLSAHKITDC